MLLLHPRKELQVSGVGIGSHIDFGAPGYVEKEIFHVVIPAATDHPFLSPLLNYLEVTAVSAHLSAADYVRSYVSVLCNGSEHPRSNKRSTCQTS